MQKASPRSPMAPVSRLPPGAPSALTIYREGDPGRSEVEDFIRAVYGARYGAQVRQFAPVLAGRRERFMPGALSLGFFAILALHLVNPDQLIMRTNLERASRGHGFDIRHAVSLSDDAMPALAAALESLPIGDQCAAVSRMRRRDQGDWRSWNISRARMQSIAKELQATVERLQSICPRNPSS